MKTYINYSLLYCIDDTIVNYCVSVETSAAGSNCLFHIHAFVEFEGKHYINDIRESVLCLFDGIRLDIQSVCSMRNVL